MKRRNRNRPKNPLREPMTLADQLGSEVRAWVFGPVVKGTHKAGGCLDVYIAGTGAASLETAFLGKRPLIAYEGDVYPMRLIGPAKVSEEIFVENHPEAVRVI